jgi:hypothetical protein
MSSSRSKRAARIAENTHPPHSSSHITSPLQTSRRFFDALDDADERNEREAKTRLVIALAERERAERVAEARVRALNISKGLEFTVTVMSKNFPFRLGLDEDAKVSIRYGIYSS